MQATSSFAFPTSIPTLTTDVFMLFVAIAAKISRASLGSLVCYRHSMVQPVIDPEGYGHIQVRVDSLRRSKRLLGTTRTWRGMLLTPGDARGRKPTLTIIP